MGRIIWLILFCALPLSGGGRLLALDPDTTVAMLRKYCKACHAGNQKPFILSEKNEEVWDFLYREKASNGNLWAKEIIRVLDWPSGDPPPPHSQMEPGREWMPLGSKRYDIAFDVVEDLPARIAIRNRLLDGQ